MATIVLVESPTIAIEENLPTTPQKAFTPLYTVSQTPGVHELDSIRWGERLNGPAQENFKRLSATLPPGTPTEFDVELTPSHISFGHESDGVGPLQSWSNPRVNTWRMLSVSLTNMASGLNDAAPGALIPYIEKYYDIGYAIVSLIFITNSLGFITAAFSVDLIRSKLGRAKTLMLANAITSCAFIPMICTPPFPVVIASFFFIGLGQAINLSLGNVFTANLQDSTTLLGVMHGAYGIGGTIAPLIATAMVTKGGFIWSRYYILTLGFTITNFILAGWSFWNFEADAAHLNTTDTLELTPSGRVDSRAPATSRETTSKVLRDMLKAFQNKTVLLGALFIFAYQGAEVSISGWVISFLISFRDGNPQKVGYVTVGFWAGITLGRFLLSVPAHKVGEKLFVYILVGGAGALQLLVWLVPNIVGEAVALALVGVVLGPVWPCAAVVFTRALSYKEQVSSFSVISAFGSSGGAVAPFMTGALAQAVGTYVLHPIALALFAVMAGCWFVLPTVRKRTE